LDQGPDPAAAEQRNAFLGGQPVLRAATQLDGNYVAVTGCDLESFGSRGMVSDRYVLVCLKGIPVGSVDI